MKEGDNIEISYDIFQSVVSDLAKLKKILFVFEDYVKANREHKK